MEGPVLIKGAGEMATGVAWRLFRSGFPVIMTEVAHPLAVRRTVSFCEAVPLGHTTVEAITARRVSSAQEVLAVLSAGEIPLLVDPQAECRYTLDPWAVVDGILAKRNLGTTIGDAPVVVALGPGFTAGVDCHAVVETQRGHWLGRVYYEGSAIPDTGMPAERGGFSNDRVVRAPISGVFRAIREIGEMVKGGDLLGYVEPVGAGPAGAGQAGAGQDAARGPRADFVPVMATIPGLLRGLIREGTPVTRGVKIGDVDPMADVERCTTISEKALAIAGGVLEALLALR